MKIAGSVALVTGANRGLGRSFVEVLLARGAAKVYAGARKTAELEDLVAAHGGKVVALPLDVTDQAQVEAAAKAAPDVTLLVNNAGVLEGAGLLEAGSVEPLQWELDVNVVGIGRMALGFAPLLEAAGANAGGAAMVNMLSVASLATVPHFGTYAASKMAAMALTQGLRCDLAEKGVEVFGIYAGFIDTGMIGFVTMDKTSPEEVASRALDGVEAGTPEIDVDERSAMVRRRMREDPEAFTKEMWQRAADFRKNFPRDKRGRG